MKARSDLDRLGRMPWSIRAVHLQGTLVLWSLLQTHAVLDKQVSPAHVFFLGGWAVAVVVQREHHACQRRFASRLRSLHKGLFHLHSSLNATSARES